MRGVSLTGFPKRSQGTTTITASPSLVIGGIRWRLRPGFEDMLRDYEWETNEVAREYRRNFYVIDGGRSSSLIT